MACWAEKSRRSLFALFRQGIERDVNCALRRSAISVSNLEKHKLENDSPETGGGRSLCYCLFPRLATIAGLELCPNGTHFEHGARSTQFPCEPITNGRKEVASFETARDGPDLVGVHESRREAWPNTAEWILLILIRS